MNAKNLGRRQFLQLSGAAVVGALGVGSLLTACAGSSSSGGGASNNTPQSGGNCEQNGSILEATGVTEGHTHTFQLTAAQINAADPTAVFITSNVGHTHSVQLTAQQYATLQANQGISLETGAAGDGHAHSLTIDCA